MAASLIPLELRTIPERPRRRHTATVIFLHGLGGGSDAMHLYAKQMRKDTPALAHVKWIVPVAPKRPVTAISGLVMPSWFDVYSADIFRRAEDEPGLLAAAASINALIDIEIVEHGIPPERIVVGGLSQGGALACLLSVTSTRRLAGAFVLSAYVPLWRKTGEIATPIARQIPIFWGHGTADRQVDHTLALGAAKGLARVLDVPTRVVVVGATDEATTWTTPEDGDTLPLRPDEPGIRFNVYEGLVHWVDEKREMKDLASWITGVVPPDTRDARMRKWRDDVPRFVSRHVRLLGTSTRRSK